MAASDDPNTRYRDEMTRTAAAMGSSIAAYMKSSHETALYNQSIQADASTHAQQNLFPNNTPSSYSASTQNQQILLHPNDVLFGRGHDIARHTGNQNFRQFIEEQKVPYSLAKTRGEKNDIVDKIIDKVHKLDPPGRFLESIDDIEEETKGGKKRKRRGGDGVTVALLRSLRCDIGIEDDSDTKVGYQIADKEKVMTKIRKALRKGAPEKALSERQLKILERKKKKAEAEEAKKRKEEEQKRAAKEDGSRSELEEGPKKKRSKAEKKKISAATAVAPMDSMSRVPPLPDIKALAPARAEPLLLLNPSSSSPNSSPPPQASNKPAPPNNLLSATATLRASVPQDHAQKLVAQLSSQNLAVPLHSIIENALSALQKINPTDISINHDVAPSSPTHDLPAPSKATRTATTTTAVLEAARYENTDDAAAPPVRTTATKMPGKKVKQTKPIPNSVVNSALSLLKEERADNTTFSTENDLAPPVALSRNHSGNATYADAATPQSSTTDTSAPPTDTAFKTVRAPTNSLADNDRSVIDNALNMFRNSIKTADSTATVTGKTIPTSHAMPEKTHCVVNNALSALRQKRSSDSSINPATAAAVASKEAPATTTKPPVVNRALQALQEKRLSDSSINPATAAAASSPTEKKPQQKRFSDSWDSPAATTASKEATATTTNFSAVDSVFHSLREKKLSDNSINPAAAAAAAAAVSSPSRATSTKKEHDGFNRLLSAIGGKKLPDDSFEPAAATAEPTTAGATLPGSDAMTTTNYSVVNSALHALREKRFSDNVFNPTAAAAPAEAVATTKENSIVNGALSALREIKLPDGSIDPASSDVASADSTTATKAKMPETDPTTAIKRSLMNIALQSLRKKRSSGCSIDPSGSADAVAAAEATTAENSSIVDSTFNALRGREGFSENSTKPAASSAEDLASIGATIPASERKTSTDQSVVDNTLNALRQKRFSDETINPPSSASAEAKTTNEHSIVQDALSVLRERNKRKSTTAGKTNIAPVEPLTNSHSIVKNALSALQSTSLNNKGSSNSFPTSTKTKNSAAAASSTSYPFATSAAAPSVSTNQLEANDILPSSPSSSSKYHSRDGTARDRNKRKLTRVRGKDVSNYMDSCSGEEDKYEKTDFSSTSTTVTNKNAPVAVNKDGRLFNYGTGDMEDHFSNYGNYGINTTAAALTATETPDRDDLASINSFDRLLLGFRQQQQQYSQPLHPLLQATQSQQLSPLAVLPPMYPTSLLQSLATTNAASTAPFPSGMIGTNTVPIQLTAASATANKIHKTTNQNDSPQHRHQIQQNTCQTDEVTNDGKMKNSDDADTVVTIDSIALSSLASSHSQNLVKFLQSSPLSYPPTQQTPQTTELASALTTTATAKAAGDEEEEEEPECDDLSCGILSIDHGEDIEVPQLVLISESTKTKCYKTTTFSYDPTNSQNKYANKQVVLKVYTDPSYSNISKERIQTEYQVTNYLYHSIQSCKEKIRLSTVVSSGGRILTTGDDRSGYSSSSVSSNHAIYMDYVDGVTLKQWIQDLYEKNPNDYAGVNKGEEPAKEGFQRFGRQVLRCAHAISNALSSLHEDGGIIHGSFTPDHILICRDENDNKKKASRGTASKEKKHENISLLKINIIGFASSEFDAHQPEDDEKKKQDMLDLGYTLFELFSGQSPLAVASDEGEEENKEKDGTKKMRKILPFHMLSQLLHSRAVPTRIMTLVLNLMRQPTTSSATTTADKNSASNTSTTSNNTNYSSENASQVTSQLDFMISNFDELFPIMPSPTSEDEQDEGKEDEKSRGNLALSDKLYGRSRHAYILMEALQRIVSGNQEQHQDEDDQQPSSSPEFILVSGYSGTGKSALVKQSLSEHVKEVLGGDFIHIKFDSSIQQQPLSAIAAAFTEFCNVLLDNKQMEQRRRSSSGSDGDDGARELKRMTTRMAIREALGNQADVLIRLIPKLKEIVRDDDVNISANNATAIAAATCAASAMLNLAHGCGGGEGEDAHSVAGADRSSSKKSNSDICSDSKMISDARHRFHFIFRLYVQAIARKSHPVVLFFDDLQWADEESLQLLQSLVTNTENKYLMFVGAYRDNEVNGTHPFAVRMSQMEQEMDVRVTNIKVENLKKEDVNGLISETIRVSSYLTISLADLIYRKTCGNVLFVRQLLQSLWEEGLLRYCFDTSTWQWDMKAIESKSISNNALGLISRKMLRLPQDSVYALKIVACLGTHFDESTLLLIAEMHNINDNIFGGIQTKHKGEENEIPEFCIINKGWPTLLQLLDVAINEGLIDKEGTKYRFVHDQIQLAAYLLIPEKQRCYFHVKIGRLLLDSSHDGAIFLGVDQMIRGLPVIQEESQKLDMARFCLKAGVKAISMAAFSSAASYLMTGRFQLMACQGRWEKHYNLCLELNASYGKAQFCNGNFSQMAAGLYEVINNSNTFADKIRAYYFLMCSLGVQNKCEEAMDLGFSVLDRLGEPFLRSPTESDIENCFRETSMMLEGKSDSEILSLKLMEDNNKIDVMQFIDVISFYAYMAKAKFAPLLMCRSLQLSLRYGLCKDSAPGFSSFGVFLCVSGNYKGGYRYGQLALKLLERLDAKDCLPRVYAGVYSGINIWSKPMRSSLAPLLEGYEAGMKCGDGLYAMCNLQCHALLSFLCGVKLPLLENKLEKFSKKMLEFKQETNWYMMQTIRQIISNLMGHSKDPVKLTGNAMEEKEVLAFAHKQNSEAVEFRVHLCCLMLAYLFGDFVLAGEIAVTSSKFIEGVLKTSFEVCIHTFFDGLTSLALARGTNQLKWRERAFKAIEKMTVWAEHGPHSCKHKLLLIEAEYHMLSGMTDKAAKGYDISIDMAGKNGFIHEQAIACERAGFFHLQCGNESNASHYYAQAYNAYMEWGAKAKADQIREKYLF